MASSAPNNKQISPALASIAELAPPENDFWAAEITECWDVSIGNNDELVGRFDSRSSAIDFQDELFDAGATITRVSRSVVPRP
jgi:hypothetical protein